MHRVRRVEASDAAEWLRLRLALWPGDAESHEQEIGNYLAGRRRDPAEVLLAIGPDGRAVGFAELSLRSHAEGCETSPVGYLEGWFVEPGSRRRGVGAALVAAAEAWARAQGCSEFASDTALDNTVSAAAHEALGFEEVDRTICFRKPL